MILDPYVGKIKTGIETLYWKIKKNELESEWYKIAIWGSQNI